MLCVKWSPILSIVRSTNEFQGDFYLSFSSMNPNIGAENLCLIYFQPFRLSFCAWLKLCLGVCIQAHNSEKKFSSFSEEKWQENRKKTLSKNKYFHDILIQHFKLMTFFQCRQKRHVTFSTFTMCDGIILIQNIHSKCAHTHLQATTTKCQRSYIYDLNV